MPCGATREAPLRLRGGGDRRLIAGSRLVAATGFIALLLADSAVILKILLVTLLVGVYLVIEALDAREPNGSLLVYPDGRCRVGGSDGRVTNGCWITRWYCVVTCSTPRGTRRALISASRQEHGEYRKLLAWLRLRDLAEP